MSWCALRPELASSTASTMTVGERMRRDVPTCRTHDTLASVAESLWGNHRVCAPVVDDDGNVLGLVRDRDICMAAWASGRLLADLWAGDVMVRGTATIGERASLLEAELLMRARGVHRLLVLDDAQHLVGILSRGDLCLAIDAGPGPVEPAAPARPTGPNAPTTPLPYDPTLVRDFE